MEEVIIEGGEDTTNETDTENETEPATETESGPTNDGRWFAESDEDKLNFLRIERNEKLLESDKYMIPDFPITEEKREEWKLYRQALRDLTITQSLTDVLVDNTFEVSGFSWPTPPSD